MNKRDRKVFVALSGGVDSAVTALLLKNEGYDLHAIHMQNWDAEVNGENLIREGKGCSNKDDLGMAEAVAKHLDIPLTLYNFVPEYWELVFVPFLDAIKRNEISNPDIFCNQKIKFGVLLDELINTHGENIQLATGHYAKIVEKNGNLCLGTSSDKKKDQTYFLSRLTTKQLSKTLFPLGNYSSKSQIREIAKKNNLPNWDKKDSTGICFVGKRKFRDFLLNYLETREGDVVCVQTKEVVGKHKGVGLYALGQKCNIGGLKNKSYVCGKDEEQNRLYVCSKDKLGIYLNSSVSAVVDLHWINERPNVNDLLFIKTKHSELFTEVTILEINNNKILVTHQPCFLTSPGQFIVFYSHDKEICLGSGVYSLC